MNWHQISKNAVTLVGFLILLSQYVEGSGMNTALRVVCHLVHFERFLSVYAALDFTIFNKGTWCFSASVADAAQKIIKVMVIVIIFY